MTGDKVLDDRKAAILRAIVSHYVRFGEPVGSKTLVSGYGLSVSPATVRNEMMALEEAGFIYQPHTSAGRIPTDWGYRHFVDTFEEDLRLPPGETRRIRHFFGEPRWELEDALRQTATFLSSLTDHAAVVFAPALDRSVVRHVELVRLAGGRAMLVIVTDTGRVENHVITIGDKMDEVQLDEAGELLRRLLLDVPLERAATTLTDGIERLPLEYRDVATVVSATLVEKLREREGNRVFLEGTSNIVDEQKFADLETVRQVIGALEHRRLMLEVVADGLSVGGVSVRIGAENQVEGMQFCSVITATYGVGETAIGSLGVVGPTRMDYRRTIAAVHEVSSNLGGMLSGLGI